MSLILQPIQSVSRTALQKAREAFVAIKADRLEVVLHEGTATKPFLSRGGNDFQNAGYDWSFEVWVPESWNRLYNDPQSFFSADHPNFRQPVPVARRVVVETDPRAGWKQVFAHDSFLIPELDPVKALRAALDQAGEACGVGGGVNTSACCRGGPQISRMGMAGESVGGR
jgi:hypothetical protein